MRASRRGWRAGATASGLLVPVGLVVLAVGVLPNLQLIYGLAQDWSARRYARDVYVAAASYLAEVPGAALMLPESCDPARGYRAGSHALRPPLFLGRGARCTVALAGFGDVRVTLRSPRGTVFVEPDERAAARR